MMDDVIVPAPEKIVRGRQNQNVSPWRTDTRHFHEKALIIIEMLNYAESADDLVTR
jgi:hypothetical protein